MQKRFSNVYAIILALQILTCKEVRSYDQEGFYPPPTNWEPTTFAMKDVYSKEEEDSQALNSSEITGGHSLPTFLDYACYPFSVFFTHPPAARDMNKFRVPIFHAWQFTLRLLKDAMGIAAMVEL